MVLVPIVFALAVVAGVAWWVTGRAPRVTHDVQRWQRSMAALGRATRSQSNPDSHGNGGRDSTGHRPDRRSGRISVNRTGPH